MRWWTQVSGLAGESQWRLSGYSIPLFVALVMCRMVRCGRSLSRSFRRLLVARLRRYRLGRTVAFASTLAAMAER